MSPVRGPGAATQPGVDVPPGGGCAVPSSGTERIFAGVLADILGIARVPVDSHFFDDLGADSMLMARFCARIRKRADLPSVTIKDVYQHPTVRRLALAVGNAAPTAAEPSASTRTGVPIATSSLEYILCGTLQLLAVVAYVCVAAVVLSAGYDWISAGSGSTDIYLRSVGFGSAAIVGMGTVPILAKWLLIGRWKPQQIRVWSLAYVRFWIVRTLVRSNPLALLFVGSPLYVLYLRALGARIGRDVAILSQNVPVCTDLLTIGDGTVVRKDSSFPCYRAHAGLIHIGPVTLGRDVVVCEASVVDIDTSLGDGAQLGHASSLHPGQAVPDGERWHGSPAQRTEADYRVVEPAGCGILRRTVYTVVQLLKVAVGYMPVAVGGVGVLLTEDPRLTRLLDSGSLTFTSWRFYLGA